MSKTRSLENLFFTITSNRTGTEKNSETEAQYRGESQICAPNGEILIKANSEERLMLTEINPSYALNKRNVISDRFPEEWNKYKVSIQS